MREKITIPRAPSRIINATLGILLLFGALTLSAALSRGIPRPDHVVVVVEENHEFEDIIGSSRAPYINSLLQQGALLTGYFALTHPSEPNYLMLFSGSAQGVSDDSCPHSYNAPNLASELLGAGLTWAGYAEDLPAAGATDCYAGAYVRRHVPWVDFTNVPGSLSLPFSSFPAEFSQLPTISFVIPNLENDMHDGSIEQGDAWLQAHLEAYRQWADVHNGLLIITFDEGSGPNHIVTLFVGPMVQPGMYCGSVGHYNLLRTLEDMFALPHAGSSAEAMPIANIWRAGNPPPTVSLTSPVDGSTISGPADIQVLVTSAPGAGAITNVQLFEGERLIGEINDPTAAFTWSNVQPGTYCLRAKAMDDAGGVSTSPESDVTVVSTTPQSFDSVKGSYSGLFVGQNAPSFTNSGFVTFNVTGKGTIAGRIVMGRLTYALHGRFDANGLAAVSVARRGQNPLAVELAIDLFNGTDQVRGEVGDGTWHADLEANLAIHGAQHSPFAGRLTLVIPGSDDAAAAPGGFGVGTAMATPAGTFRLGGTLGDGTRFAQMARVPANGRIPLYCPLYGGAGALFGWLEPANAVGGTPGGMAATSSGPGFRGDVFWFKPARARDQLYSAGFLTQTRIDGAPYVPPPVDWASGVVVLTGGNLPIGVTNTATISNNHVSASDPAIRLAIAAPTGAVNGKVVHPATGRPVRVQAVVQQWLNVVAGSFQGATETGSILIRP